jgi:transposase
MSIYIGIDWSQDKHDVAFMNAAGAIIARLTIPHQPDGFRKLETTRQQLAVTAADCLVGLETAHNLLLDFLWDHDYQHIYVIPPWVVKSSRGRYGHSGARDDTLDAQLLADLLRTDRARLQPWQPDSQLTRQIRARVGFISFLTHSANRTHNRLRAALLRYYPQALELFSGLMVPATLAFIAAYNTPQALAALSYETFVAFAHQQGCWNRQVLVDCYARLQHTPLQASPATVAVYQDEARLLAQQLRELILAKRQVQRDLNTLFVQHPDQAIFASLPGVGDFLAPALLAKLGDDRDRFPSAASLQALAGTCPVTVASGKHKRVIFRQACDHQFRQIAQQWARCSLRKSVWAVAYWQQIRPRCASDHDAYRRLANRWLAVLWKLWQSRELYDEAYHLQQRRLRSQPLA